jgi:CMP-N-acetylneuraminic acid synthetase
MTKITAIVPMRHSSERIPGKNYRPFCGKPLFHHIILQLTRAPIIHEIVVDTDSPIIMRDVEEHFPDITILERRENLRKGTIPMNDVLLNTVNSIDSDFYLQTHSTNPLLKSITITKAVNYFLENYPMYDSLFSVTKIQKRLWDKLGRAINHNPAILLRTQDLPSIYEENSCVYIFTKEILELRRNRIGERPLMFEMDPLEAWDIDEESDFKIAEAIFREIISNNDA